MRAKISKKSQLISTDFLIAFVVFIFALSFFFFTMRGAISYENVNLDAPAELIFNRLDQVYPRTYDYLDGSKIDTDKLDKFIWEKKPKELFEIIFSDFENPAFFTKIDYCIFIENKSIGRTEIIRNFAAHGGKNNSVFIGDDECGKDITINFRRYSDISPKCTLGEEVLSLSKPVLYRHDFMFLKILMCAQKR